MKNFQKHTFLAFFIGLLSFSSSAQVAEDTIKVEGVCGMCKNRIEEAAYGKGVKFVSWDKATKDLVIAYKANKVSLDEIEQRIAEAGHSTQNVKAKKEDYESLPDCCQYEHVHDH